jgi:hypothetical protein
MLTTTVNNFIGIIALRFVLSGAEACIGPAWMLLTSMFWIRQEQPLRMCKSWPLLIQSLLTNLKKYLNLYGQSRTKTLRAWWLGCNGLSSMISAGLS